MGEVEDVFALRHVDGGAIGKVTENRCSERDARVLESTNDWSVLSHRHDVSLLILDSLKRN